VYQFLFAIESERNPLYCRLTSKDLARADEEKKEILSRLVPTYEALASSSKIHLIQSLVSRLLVDHVFEAYFVGLSKEHADELLKVEKSLGKFGTNSKGCLDIHY